MRVAPPVTLDHTQRNTLQQWARSRSLPARQIERAKVVLLAAEGKTDLENRRHIEYQQPESRALAEAVSAVESGRPGKGCVPSWPQTHHPSQGQRRADSEDNAGQAGQRHSLEHAHDGG